MSAGPLYSLALAAGLLAVSPALAASIETQELAAPQRDAGSIEYSAALLQGLNKVTGHISKIELPVGTVTRFGTLEIVAHRCWQSLPEDRPENAALLEISELKPAEAPARIFMGWIFSSSPGLSGLEHAVYDITLLSCEAKPHPEKETPEEDSKIKE